MIIDNYIDRLIGKTLLRENEDERKNHKSSGKLSAGMLNDPLQWQILKILGVEGEALDEYVVRKFKRGKDIEEWLINFLKPVETQKFVEYRNTVGYIDAIVDTTGWDFPVGIVPLECKSVANAKFKRILGQGADKGHRLQGAFYAMCQKTENFIISYVAADDLRVQSFVEKTADYAEEIEGIITKFQKQLETGLVPVFEAREKWQENPKYNRYPEWSVRTAVELEKLKVGHTIKNKR